MTFPHAINIKINNEVAYNNEDIRLGTIIPKKDIKYYLIVKLLFSSSSLFLSSSC